MKIAIDGMGGDNAPSEIVKGAVLASKETNYQMIIVGQTEKIEEELAKYQYDKEQIQILDAREVIENDDSPVKAVRKKTNSSMVVGVNLLKNDEAQMLISAGNTGALMTAGLFNLGRIPGIDRPAIATTYPVLGKGVSLLVDSGANSECKPGNLLEFAIMGSLYMELVFGIKKPTVGLVNIGTEDTKGTTVIKAANELLKKSHINFIGNVEARDIPDNAPDVLVCDGFVGNIIIKLTEGVAIKLMKVIKGKLTEGFLSKLGMALSIGKLNELKGMFDYSEYGGAPILGVKGALIKAHGSSNSNAIKCSILKAIPYMENQVVKQIQEEVINIEEIEEE